MLMPYHAGIIVDDIERAMRELAGRLGYTFNPPTTLPLPQLEDRLTGRTEPLNLVACYTREGPFFLELIQGQGDGVYSADLAGLHHLGVWESDVEARLEQLESSGEQVDAIIRRGNGRISAIYSRPTPAGARIEYVNDDRRKQLEEWFRTGVMPT